MWWLVTLLVLALVSFFIVKSMKAGTQSKQIEHDAAVQDRLEQSADVESASIADEAKPSSAAASDAVAGTAADKAVAGAVSGASIPSANLVDTGDTLSDVREMIKILNLDGPDAARLNVSREQLTALRKGDSAGIPDASSLEDVAARLRRMLA